MTQPRHWSGTRKRRSFRTLYIMLIISVSALVVGLMVGTYLGEWLNNNA